MDREEAYAMFDELNPDFAATLDTKGIVNILPTVLYGVIMPKDVMSMPISDQIEETKQESAPSPDSGHIQIMDFNTTDRVARLTTRRTELLGSGSRVERKNSIHTHSRIDEKIKEITQKIPTLQPVMGKILGNRFRHMMSLVSHKSLAGCSVAAGLAIMLQICLSKNSRRLSLIGIKIALFMGAISVLGVSILGLFIKYIHNQVEEPKKPEEEEEAEPQKYPSVRRLIEERTKIKSRFNTKGDKRSFFSPDLNMAL